TGPDRPRPRRWLTPPARRSGPSTPAAPSGARWSRSGPTGSPPTTATPARRRGASTTAPWPPWSSTTTAGWCWSTSGATPSGPACWRSPPASTTSRARRSRTRSGARWPGGRGERCEAALRGERAEEVGVEGGTLTFLASFYPTPGWSDEVLDLYLAEGVTPIAGDAPAAEWEEQGIEVVRVPFSEALRRAAGPPGDAKTLVALGL